MQFLLQSLDGSNDIVEFVRVSLKFDHAAPWNIGVRLQSPDGTIINLMQPLTNVNNPGGALFDIGVSGFYGESMEGDGLLNLWIIRRHRTIYGLGD